MSGAPVLVLKSYGEQERRNADIARMHEEMRGMKEPQGEFPSLEDKDEGWGLEDDPADDTTQPFTGDTRDDFQGLGQRAHQEWQRRLAQRTREEGAMAGRPDIAGPASTARGLARQKTQQPLIHSNQGNENFGFNYPSEMGQGRPPIMARKAFGHAMEMLKSRYFG